MRQSANTLQRTSAISSSAVSGIPDLILRNAPARTSVPRTTDNGRSDFSAYISVRFLPILTRAADSIFGSDTSHTAEDSDYVLSAMVHRRTQRINIGTGVRLPMPAVLFGRCISLRSETRRIFNTCLFKFAGRSEVDDHDLAVRLQHDVRRF